MKKEEFKRNLRIIRRKKWPFALLAVVLAAAVALPVFNTVRAKHGKINAKNPISLSDVFIKKTDRAKITLIAHRGFSCIAPENTVPAIEKAGEYGFDTVEIDVRQTEDGVWVLSHDNDVTRMTDKRGEISSYTYYDLVTCKIDNGANYKQYTDLKIPTLEQALRACLKYNIKPMIEVKSYSEGGIESLMKIIEKNGFTSSCSIISFDRKILSEVRSLNKDVQLFALVSKLSNKEVELCLADPTIGVSFCGTKKINSAEKIKKLSNAGIPLACWTIDSAEDMQRCYEMGITAFVTNRIYNKTD